MAVETAVEVAPAGKAEITTMVDVQASPLPSAVEKNGSFREESNRPSDLKESERRALADLRDRLEAAILDGTLLKSKNAAEQLDVAEGEKPALGEPEKKDVEVEVEEKKVDAADVKPAASAAKDVTLWRLIFRKSAAKTEKKEAELEEKKEAEPEEKKEAEPEEKKEAEEAGEENIETAEAGEEMKEVVEAEDEKEEAEAAADAEEEKPADAEEEKTAEAEENAYDSAEPEAEKNAEEAESKKDLAAAAAAVDRDISLWGVPLLPSKNEEGTDIVLLKFLRARDFKVAAALTMIANTLKWRKEYGVDAIVDEENPLASDLDAACYIDGVDREGHPVCYNVFGVLSDEELYKKVFGAEGEGKERFVRWRVGAMEAGVKKLQLRPGGVASLLQITDLKGSPGPARKELKVAMKEVVELLQDNYPEMVARNIFINVPFWYYAFSTLFNPFLTQRTRSKFVFARPSRVTETLLKYIPAEAIPVKYGGLKREEDTVFFEDDTVSELVVKANAAETIEIPVAEGGLAVTWDLVVLGWEVNYKEEFVPDAEGSYTIIIRKGKKMEPGEEAIRNMFRSCEAGKVVLTVENPTHKKKKVLFRHKATSSKAC